MIKRKITFKPRWLNRPLYFVLFVALFFSLSMTWVEMDPVMDHQKNVDILRGRIQKSSIVENVLESELNSELIPEKRNRQTDGIIFGSALLAMIIIGGIMANNRTYQ